jgi:hypothetical protein
MTMGEFKVVVGMDWLSRYHANVICNRKVIQLISPSGKHVYVHGEKNYELMMCSMMEARKYIQHGCKAYLTYVRDVDAKVNQI